LFAISEARPSLTFYGVGRLLDDGRQSHTGRPSAGYRGYPVAHARIELQTSGGYISNGRRGGRGERERGRKGTVHEREKALYLAHGAVHYDEVDFELRKRRDKFSLLRVSQCPRGVWQAMLSRYAAVGKGRDVGLTPVQNTSPCSVVPNLTKCSKSSCMRVKMWVDGLRFFEKTPANESV
jgi:hypothetical protein